MLKIQNIQNNRIGNQFYQNPNQLNTVNRLSGNNVVILQPVIQASPIPTGVVMRPFILFQNNV